MSHQRTVDMIYRLMVMTLAMELTKVDTEYFRYYCSGTLYESKLVDRSLLDIMRELERADVLSCNNLDFLKSFLKGILHSKLINKLIETETQIQVLQTMGQYKYLKSTKQQFNNKENDAFRVAERFLRINNCNRKLVNGTNVKECEEFQNNLAKDYLSMEVSRLLNSEETPPWTTVKRLFAVACELEAGTRNSEQRCCTELQLLISSLIVKLGGWDEFMKNLKTQTAGRHTGFHDEIIKRNILDAVYCENITSLLENHAFSENNVSRNSKSYDCSSGILKRPFHLSRWRSQPHLKHTTHSFSNIQKSEFSLLVVHKHKLI